MTSRTRMLGLAACLLNLTTAGCQFVGSTTWTTDYETIAISDKVTVDDAEQRSLDVAGLTALKVRTHNGRICFVGHYADQPGTIKITKKAGGLSVADAEAASAAIEVFVERDANGRCNIGWRWSESKHRSWRGCVDFEIIAPENLELDFKTHNGRVQIAGAKGDVRVVSHNGRLILDASGGELHGKTHNGRIEATYEGEQVTLITHNGRISADLRGCAAPHGEIRTHNGRVEVMLDDQASTQLSARTHNGSVSCQKALTDSQVSKSKLAGKIGDGKGRLGIVTHNGSIKIW